MGEEGVHYPGVKGCNKLDMKLGNIGKRALLSHIKSKSHKSSKSTAPNIPISMYFREHSLSVSRTRTENAQKTSCSWDQYPVSMNRENTNTSQIVSHFIFHSISTSGSILFMYVLQHSLQRFMVTLD